MVVLFIPTTGFLLELDTTLKEEHTADSKTTKHPVEQGVKVTDHVRPEPRELVIEGIVSNTPVTQRQYNQASTALNPPYQMLGTSASAGTTVAKVSGWAEYVWKTLVDARDKSMLFTVMANVDTYADMVMTSLKATKDAKTGDSIRLNLKFEELRQVVTGTTVVATKQPKGKPKVSKGTKATQAAPTQQSAFGNRGRQRVNQITGTSGRGYVNPPTPAPTPGHS